MVVAVTTSCHNIDLIVLKMLALKRTHKLTVAQPPARVCSKLVRTKKNQWQRQKIGGGTCISFA
jgi:hypothetical protein